MTLVVRLSLTTTKKKVSESMITIKSKNYIASDFVTLYSILKRGSSSVLSHECVDDCEGCQHRTVCQDISLAMTYLDNKIMEKTSDLY